MQSKRLLQGVGLNDADYAVQRFIRVNGKLVQQWICPFYRTWSHMIQRCYSGKLHSTRPTYERCYVCDEWLIFSRFRDWMIGQDWNGMELDKDIIFQGNRVYSPETCVFVESKLNCFLCDAGTIRGKWPLGVCFKKSSSKFMSQCCNPFSGRREFLGYFHDPESAHEAWRSRKHQHAMRYADMQTDPRIADALRSRYAQKKEPV